MKCYYVGEKLKTYIGRYSIHSNKLGTMYKNKDCIEIQNYKFALYV